MMNRESTTHVASLLASLLVASLAFSQVAQADKIYRSIDNNGNVYYSDQPPGSNVGNATEIQIDGGNTYRNPIPRKPYEPDQQTTNSSDSNEGGDRYNSVVITYPANDANFRDNAGNVKIGTRLSPNLKNGDRLLLVLDGQRTQLQPSNNEILLRNVARGTHRISLVVVNQRGEVKIASDERVFHLQRISINSPGVGS